MISLHNITKSYNLKKRNEVQVLKGINLVINADEMVAITGTSGAGKSTLLRILGCIEKTTTGDYLLDGRNINQQNHSELALLRNSHFGFVLQNFGLIEYRSALDNISIPLVFSKTSYQDINIKCMKIMKQLGIDHLAKNKISTLSGGERQRVAIARAMINAPQIILADEPTGSLDPSNSDNIIEMLVQLNNEGKTVIIVTHDKDIAKNCGRVINIEDGRILN